MVRLVHPRMNELLTCLSRPIQEIGGVKCFAKMNSLHFGSIS